jgi:hypothetical protein
MLSRVNEMGAYLAEACELRVISILRGAVLSEPQILREAVIVLRGELRGAKESGALCCWTSAVALKA